MAVPPRPAARTGPSAPGLSSSHRGRVAPRSVRDEKGHERVSARTVLAVIGIGAAAVVALWWHSTPDVSGLGGWLTGAGEILGLLAGYGVVVLVALMARLPPLERGIGSDRLARWHAMGGRYIVSLVVAHGLLILWGYAVEAHASLTSETATLLTQYPDVLMATVAGFLLLGVGIISMRAARRRVRYETWYYLHLYTYLAIALAFSHQFAVGASFISDLAARFWWSAMYLAVAAAVLWYRVAVPLRAFARHEFTVVGVKPEGPGVTSVYIGGAHLDELAARARAVLPLAVPDQVAVVVVAPVLAVRRAGRRPAADHGEGHRRPQPGPVPAAAGHPGHRRGPVRRVHGRAHRPRRGAAGRRGGHHPAAGHVLHAARPGHAGLPREQRAGHRVPGRAGRHRGRPRGQGVLRGRVAGRDRRRSAVSQDAALARARPGRARRPTYAGRPAWSRPRSRRCVPPGCRGGRSTSSRSSSEGDDRSCAG